MKKIMNFWLSGTPISKVVHLSNNKISLLTNNLLAIRSFVTKDFARRPRSIDFLKRWKATELRQLLLYTAPVVLHDVLHQQVYSHVMTFHVALRILSSENLIDVYSDYAQELLEHFVDTFKVLYGKHYVSHNVHGLLHLVDDVKLLGPLDSFSAFQFENCLRILKMQLRKSDRPVQQIHRRYAEKSIVNPPKVKAQDEFSDKHFDGPTTMTSDINSPDNVCIINNNIIAVQNILYDNNLDCMVVIGKPYIDKTNLYEIPCPSSLLNCYAVTYLAQNNEVWPISDIEYKCLALPWNLNGNSCLAVFPLLHSDCKVNYLENYII